MEKLKSNFVNMLIVLTAFSLLAAGALGYVYKVTKAPIALAQTAKQKQAIKDVLPAFDHIDAPDSIDGFAVFKAYDAQNHFVGAAVDATGDSFGGPIKVMVGFDKEGNIVNYSVLENQDTPGLGVKMITWFKTKKNHQDIIGLNPARDNLTVTKDGGEVDAITAATISSRAFLKTVAVAYHVYVKADDSKKVDSQSGATQHHKQ